jgi:galactose mutarotase-like enzyme
MSKEIRPMSQTPETVAIRSDLLSAEINLLGAQLWSLRDETGHDLLWDGNPAVWANRAPILFPIIGEAQANRVRVDGVDYPMERHGIARRQPFAIAERSEAAVRLRLEANDTTRKLWPFDFRLDMIFAIVERRLEMVAEVTNTGARVMPASFGWHPALVWPLPYGAAREDHLMRFEHAEPAALRGLDQNGLVRPARKPSPLVGRDLALTDSLFTGDALIWDELESRRLVYGAPGTPALDITFPDMPMLGIWTKSGAGYVCVEPWAGHADPSDFHGEMMDKPHIHRFAPGETRAYHMSIERTEGPVDL